MARTQSGGGRRERAFAEYLLANGLLGREALRQAMDTQSLLGGRLDTVLLDLGLLREEVLLRALGRFRSTRTVSGRELQTVPPKVARAISPRMALRLEVVPFRREGRTLSVATLNPSDLLVEDELAQLTGCMVASFVALEVRLYEAMARLYGIQPSMQVTSVLRRLEESGGAEAPPDQSVGGDGARPVGERPAVAAAVGSRQAPTTLPISERPQVLEISKEELEQFPSLVPNLQAEHELHGRPSDEARALSLDQLLERATEALQNAEMREDIGDAVLAFCAPLLERRLLLAVRGGTIVGWRGEGERLHPAAVQAISIPAAEPSVFAGIGQGGGFWFGPLPRIASSDLLLRALGGIPPAECIVLPLVVRGKTVAFLYGDNCGRAPSGMPISHLRRLAAKAGLAFQIYLLRSKIRHL